MKVNPPYTPHPCGIYGPRNLVLRHAHRAKQRLLARAAGTVADEPPIPPPGHEQLLSFWAPALEAGAYTASVEQDVTAGSQSLHLPEQGVPAATQMFDVVAPRFHLPDDAVQSSFPPPGSGALANTLPHVVLRDPHLPWARAASAHPAKGDADYGRNMTPWLALLVFTQDELRLSRNDFDDLFADTSKKGASQSQTLSTNLPVAEVSKIRQTVSPISGLIHNPSDDADTDVILVPSSLFSEFVTEYDTNGKPVESQTGPDVSRYKYLAHARDINTEGMAESGVERNGIFGIIVSHRVGPLSNTQSQPVVAHLVSIEGVESAHMKKNWPIQTPYVALASLYSWNFLTLPAGSFSIVHTLRALGTGLGLLRAPDTAAAGLPDSALGSRLRARIHDGYTITRYRTSTGEQTAALFRGPLTPTRVQDHSFEPSSSGIDLQIMDPQLGLVDVSYSAAWQLGRALAVADRAFSAALGRLRATLLADSVARAKADILRRHGVFQTRAEAVVSLTSSLPALHARHKLSAGLHAPAGSMADRWRRPSPAEIDLSYYSPLVQEVFDEHAAAAAHVLSRSSSGGGEAYDEINTADSADWKAVLQWVMNRLFLYSVPAHYLVPDPVHLPPESLRFFHVDHSWTAALVDGALSLGKHLAGPDRVRARIHTMIREHVDHGAQVPRYGFFVRSEAITHYPDLRVAIELAGIDPAHDPNPIVRHENLDVAGGVMLCLLDQLPGTPGLRSITLTEPPHQQSFIAAAELDNTRLRTLYKCIFTVAGEAPNPKPCHEHVWERSSGPGEDDSVKHATSVFKWGDQGEVRTLLPTSWAADISTVLNQKGTDGKYVDPIPSAAMVGIQLDNPIYRLKIGEGGQNETETTVVRPFPPVESATTFPFSLESQPTEPQSLAMRPKTLELAQAKPTASQQAPQVGRSFSPGPSHGRPAMPPPHYRPVRPLDPPSLPSAPQLPPPSFGGPVRPPSYSYRVRPSDNDPANPGIPCGTGVPKDLVFSVVQDPYDGPDFTRLTELQIRLPRALTEDDADCILDPYTGPGPFMASNVRFVVLTQEVRPTAADPTPYLALRLLPRSSRGWALPSMCREMTFVLPMCMVRSHDPTVQSPMITIEMFDGRPPVPDRNFDAVEIANP